MTTHLGSLGTPRPALDATFDYFGLVIRVHPGASDLDLVEFMTEAATLDEANVVKGMVAVGRYLRGIVHPDDWDTFWQASKANQQTMTDLMTTAGSIMEAVVGFPTGQPSDSRAGRRATAKKSKAGSSSRDTSRALTLLKGRPDLQAAVVRAQEARAG